MYPLDAELKITESDKLFSNTVSLNDYVDEKVRNLEWGPKPEIAVIYVTGSIVRGESNGYGNFSPKTIGDETYFAALQDVFKDSRVKAVVIRIDSGGGSSIASELMWHYLVKLKQEYNKPVIFSFGNIAASGGYYIACTGDRILSSRGSVTGSIGVFTGKLSLKELYAKLGINKDIIKMSEFADIFSEAKDMSAEERRVIEQGVDYVYKRFVEKVAEARPVAKANIEKATEGRVFTGSQAKNNGLVDSYGGLIAAIDLAKKITGINNAFIVRHLPKTPTPILDLFGPKSSDKEIAEKLKAFLEILDMIDFKDEHTLYYFPYKLVIK
jgi:protease-4